jgi:hypothetical protein
MDNTKIFMIIFYFVHFSITGFEFERKERNSLKNFRERKMLIVMILVAKITKLDVK